MLRSGLIYSHSSKKIGSCSQRKNLLENNWDVSTNDTMDVQEHYQKVNAENDVMVITWNHGGQTGAPMIEELAKTEHDGAPLQ